MNKSTFVLFHDDSDGFASAVSVYLVYGDTASYKAVQYGQPFPNIPLDKEIDIIIVDFSYSREILESVNSKVNSLLVIDHHETAKDQLKDLPYAVFDLSKSAAMLCWEFYHKNKVTPKLIELVQDRDMWWFKLEDSKAFEAGIHASGKSKDLKFWTTLVDEENLQSVISQGKPIVANIESIVSSFIKSEKFKVTLFAGYRVGVFNTTSLISELGEAVYKQTQKPVDFSMSYFVTTEGVVVFSLRAPEKSDIHVGRIAKQLGGGGHAKAAGFSKNLSDGFNLLALLYSSL